MTFAQQLIWFVTGFSIRRPGFDPSAVYIQFVVGKVKMKRSSYEYRDFSVNDHSINIPNSY